MSSLPMVVGRAKELVTPSPAEERKIGLLAKSLLAKTAKAAGRFPEARGVLIGGSFAKGTWLPGHVDLDIFVKIDPSISDEAFEGIGLEVGRTATLGYPAGKKYAQHPYTEAMVEGVRVNIVPCFAVAAGEWKSAADRSPFHVKLIEKLPPEQKTQVRLLKLFMNGIGVYGAEIQRQGFSGYVAEVLVTRHGSLLGTLDWFASRSAGGTRFTLPDPVDESRDLGIAVSGESLGRMVLASREFLRRPGLAFFRRMSGQARPGLREEVYAVLFSHQKISEDTLWGELRKTTRHIVRHLETQGFKVARSMAASDNLAKSAILLIPEFTELPAMEQRVGPTVDRRKDVGAFITANSKVSRLVWVDEEARVRLLRPRKHRSLDDFLKRVVTGKEGPIGVSRELEAGMKKNAVVISGASLRRKAESARWLQDGIREITTDAVGAR